MKNRVVLKNVSDKTFAFEVTDNPLSTEPQISIREDAGLAVPQDMEVNEAQQFTQKEAIERGIRRNPAFAKRLSKLVKISFVSGEEIAFSKGGRYNLAQAEYIYRQFGGYAEDSYGNEMKQPIVELDENGEEDRTNFFRLYRMKKPLNVAQPQMASREQFAQPEAKK